MPTPATPPETGPRVVVCVEIGNSDDKLTQARWADFCIDMHGEVEHYAHQVYGMRHSEGGSPWQNACWHFVIDRDKVDRLTSALAAMAYNYDQDSVAWSEIAATTFIGPPQ